MIKVGDRIPSATLREVRESGPQETTSDEFFKGKKVALFAVPGAFTSTCSVKHLPSFANNADALRGKGVDRIACVAVNDASVMRAWSDHSGTSGKVTMLSDGNGDFTRGLGLEADMTKFGMGRRSRRYSMLVEDGVVKQLNLEEPGAFGASSGDHMLSQM
jgi:glutaredoxin/glutathione-dependent peroxiredoxin